MIANNEQLEELKSDIRELDDLISAEVRKLKYRALPLKSECFKTYYRLTKKRNDLLNKCISVLEELNDSGRHSIDKTLGHYTSNQNIYGKLLNSRG